MPVEAPTKPPPPIVIPQQDPEKTLNPKRLCPEQQDDLTKIIRRNA